jgi:hypothetical protein
LRQKFLSFLARVSYITPGPFFLYLETEVFVLPGQGFHGSGGTLEGALDLHNLHHTLESKKLKVLLSGQ